MKKLAIFTSILALTACSAVHNGKIGMTIDNSEIQFTPQEAHVSINTSSKLSGAAECTSLLWLFDSVPERKTFGPKLQESAGVIASGGCVAAAVYDAMKGSDADILVAPQYTTVQNGVLCFGNKCLVGTTKVLVKGYAGNITSITDMDRTVVHEKQKANTTSKSSGLF
ncbi:MAG: hypothetical protein ACI4NZ_01775 [Candidatus Enterousia sp.]